MIEEKQSWSKPVSLIVQGDAALVGNLLVFIQLLIQSFINITWGQFYERQTQKFKIPKIGKKHLRKPFSFSVSRQILAFYMLDALEIGISVAKNVAFQLPKMWHFNCIKSVLEIQDCFVCSLYRFHN